MTSAFRRAAMAFAAVTSLWLAAPASAKGPDSLADLASRFPTPS